MWTNPLIEHFITYLKISIYYYLFSSLSLGGMLVALTCEFILTFGRIFLILCRNEAFTRPSLKYFMHVSILFSSKSIAKLSVQLSPSIWFSFSSWSDLSMLSQGSLHGWKIFDGIAIFFWLLAATNTVQNTK